MELQETILDASIASHRKEISRVKNVVDYDHLYHSISELAIESIRVDSDVVDLFEDDEPALEKAIELTTFVLPILVMVSPADPARLVPAN